MSAEMRTLVEGLLKREVEDRLGCLGNGLVGSLSYVLSNVECECVEPTILLLIFSSSPTPVSDNYVLPTLKHSLSVGRAAVLETGPLPPQDHKSGTVCCPISLCELSYGSSCGYRRHFYSDNDTTAQSELFLTVPNTNILIYLLN